MKWIVESEVYGELWSSDTYNSKHEAMNRVKCLKEGIDLVADGAGITLCTGDGDAVLMWERKVNPDRLVKVV